MNFDKLWKYNVMKQTKLSLQCVPSLVLHRSIVSHSIDSSFGFSNKRCLRMILFLISINTILIINKNIPLHAGQSNELSSNSPSFSFAKLMRLLLVDGAEQTSPLCSPGDMDMFVSELQLGWNCLTVLPKGVLCCSNWFSICSPKLYCCRHFVKRIEY